MTDRPSLSKGEMEVASTLWSLGTGTVRQVHESLQAAAREIDFATVQTYLRRLETKGYVRGKLQGRTRVYAPRVQPRTVIKETIGELVDRLFGGEAFPLMRHLIEDRRLGPDDVAELRALLDRLEKERGSESAD